MSKIRGKKRRSARRRLIALYGESCVSCGATENLGIDHIRSRKIGGCSWLSNLQLLCLACNREKGHAVIDYRPPHPWMERHMANHDTACPLHGGNGQPTKSLKALVFETYGNRCLACGAEDLSYALNGRMEADVMITIDHVIPKSKGGTNDINNLQPLCKPCNNAKADTIVDYR